MPKLTPEETKAEEARMLEEVVAADQMCEEAPLVFTWLLTAASILLVIITAPFSLLCTLKVVQEITFVSTVQWPDIIRLALFRNMKRLSSSGWVGSSEAGREALASSSFCPALTSSRLWTCGSRTGQSHLRR